MDPKIDFAFKQIFAGKQKESKIVLISLLNAILDRKDQEAITDIIYLNPYTDKPYEDAKQSILDIKVKTAEEELIDIEIQIRNIDNYRKRSLYYWSTMYGEQIIEGEAYYELNPCIVINIMDFNLLDETDRYHSIFEIRERNLGFQLVSDLEIHYLELRKLAEEVDINNLTTLEEWLIFIRDAAKKEKRELIETIRKRNEVIDMAEKILARASADEMARAAYQQRRKWYLDKVSSEKYLLMKGREEGREEVAKAALRKEMPIEIISEITGLTIEDIKKLKEKMKG
jgi:predicted transposase/invertase (TIGR01784 family)